MAVLSLWTAVVNVNVPEPVPLLTVPPVAVTAYTLLADVVIPVPDIVYGVVVYVCKNVLPVKLVTLTLCVGVAHEIANVAVVPHVVNAEPL